MQVHLKFELELNSFGKFKTFFLIFSNESSLMAFGTIGYYLEWEPILSSLVQWFLKFFNAVFP